ncbi:MAG: CpaD family pilus assembly lipoprotein [Thiohalocapsa sp.]
MRTKLHYHFAAAVVMLALTGCAAQYTASEWPKDLTLDSASARIDVAFAPGLARLFARDAARLRRLAATGAIAPSDRITVSPGGSPALAQARFETVASVLLPYRVVATQGPLAPEAPNRAVIRSERYMVTLPPCPNWSKFAPLGYTNTHASNWGCTTAVDLALMVASPADLVEGRPVGTYDAIPAAAAVQRYQADKVQLPSAATLGIAGGATGATGSGATGAGTAGSQP